MRVAARLNVGGVARHVAWLTAGLTREGFQSTLVSGTVPPGEEDMTDFVREQGVEPVIIPEMTRELSPRDIITIWKLYRLFRQTQPDVVHTHTAKAGAVGRIAGLFYRWFTPWTLLGRPKRCRFVHTYHGHIFHSYYGRWKTRLFILVERILARLVTDRIVVISPQQYREIHEMFGVGRAHQFVIIPLGLDLDIFRDSAGRRHIVRQELGARDDEILVGIVGRLTEIKNHELFLNMAAEFEQRRDASAPHVRFLIIGDGHLRHPLEQLARSLGVEHRVQFLGMRNDPENFYPALDIVALTSRNEGTPLTLIEAMANARPVITTNVGGVVDLVGPVEAVNGHADLGYRFCSRGVLVRPNDAQAFCRGLTRLVQDPGSRRRLGARGQRFVETNHAQARLVRDVAALYQDLFSVEGAEPPEQTTALHPRAVISAESVGERCAS